VHFSAFQCIPAHCGARKIALTSDDRQSPWRLASESATPGGPSRGRGSTGFVDRTGRAVVSDCPRIVRQPSSHTRRGAILRTRRVRCRV
jgi:hypothetical protein